MRSYARNIGTQASTETLKNDMINNDSTSLDTDTVLSYVNALKKIFVVEESPAWNPNLRSKTAIRTSDTRYFVDPSISVVHLRNGSYLLVKIKLGGDKLIEKSVENLIKLRNKIDTNIMSKPSFMMILTAVGKYAYQREDGIYIVPIGCLKN